MDDLQSLIEQEKEIIRKEEQDSNEIVFKTPEKDTEKAEIVEKNPANLELIDKGIDAAVLHKIKNDENVQNRMLNTAEKVIDNKLSEKENDSERIKKEAVLKNNKDACDLYGIDEKTVPVWVVKIANVAQNFWYIVWLIIGFVTTAPIVFLCKKISVVFKRTWIAVLLAIVIYLCAVFVPLLINYLS